MEGNDSGDLSVLERASVAPRNRRDFLRAAGLGGAAIALAACGTEPTAPVRAAALPLTETVGLAPIVLDFSSDVGVLNYAYALEQLEAAFYAQVVANASFASIFPANEQRLLNDLAAHEVIHRNFFAVAIDAAAPGKRIGMLTPNFTSIQFNNRLSVLNTAQAFEDLGVSAYNGAGQYIQNSAYLTLTGKIVSVEARHASAIRDLLSSKTGAFAPNILDAPNTPAAVIMTAGAYITDTISVINA